MKLQNQFELGLPENPVLFDQPLKNFAKPEVTILIPTMNEEVAISQFLEWVKIGLTNANVIGEILIVDSSSDHTPLIAFSSGARVLRVPKNGLGNAYKTAAPFVRGDYVILGDADCTYDFRVLNPFLEELRTGNSFVMGNRFAGEIEQGSMPILHRYFGTPLTSWLLRRMHALKFGDIHCGMRGLTTELFRSLPFDEPGWEYAPEMVIRASQLATSTSEVPINFLKEPKGRISHFRRGKFAWISPIRAGLGSVRVTLIHALDKILVRIGTTAFLAATIAIIIVTSFDINLGKGHLGNGSAAILALIGVTGFFMILLGYLLKRLFTKSTKSQSRFSRMLGFEFATFMLILCTVVTIAVGTKTSLDCSNFDQCFSDTNSKIIRANIALFYFEIIAAITWIGSIVRSYLNYNSTYLAKE